MSKVPLKRKSNTKVLHNHVGIDVYYHGTRIVTTTPTSFTLNSGGWHTLSTKQRMNQTSQEYNLGFHVWQMDWKWYVDYQGKTNNFYDGITFDRSIT